MSDLTLNVIYIAGVVAQILIRAPFDRQRRQNKVVTNQVSRQEALVLGSLFFGMLILPALYIFTPWLGFADYALPDWAGWCGAAVLVVSLYVFWRSHADLGRNWSPTLEVREGHTVVTDGIYRYIRHPMYASQWLFVIAQALLLQNWVAGVGGMLCFLPLYIVRVPREEQMMLDAFGEEYRDYMRRTGRVLPRFKW